MSEQRDPLMIVAALAVLGVAYYVWRKGGITGAAAAVGAGVVNAAGGVATGVIDGVSTGIGIPTTSETETDPAVARWIIDRDGYFTASLWCGAGALAQGAFMASGSGRPPAANSAYAKAHPGTPTASTVAYQSPADVYQWGGYQAGGTSTARPIGGGGADDGSAFNYVGTSTPGGGLGYTPGIGADISLATYGQIKQDASFGDVISGKQWTGW